MLLQTLSISDIAQATESSELRATDERQKSDQEGFIQFSDGSRYDGELNSQNAHG